MPDQRFKFLCDLYAPVSKVPAVLSVTDIAGLIKGAAEGAGLGNAFLVCTTPSHAPPLPSVAAALFICIFLQGK